MLTAKSHPKLAGQTVHFQGTNSTTHTATVYDIKVLNGVAYGHIGDIDKGTRERPVQGFLLQYDDAGTLTAASWYTLEERPGP